LTNDRHYVGFVAGTHVVIGRNVYAYLQSRPDWHVRGVSRRQPILDGDEHAIRSGSKHVKIRQAGFSDCVDSETR